MHVDLVKLLLCLSQSLDFSYAGLLNHHQRVALMSLSIGQAAGLTEAQLFPLFQAAIIHDAGAVTWREKASLTHIDIENPWDHCRRGAEFTAGIRVLEALPEIILSHHDRWGKDNPSGYRGDRIPLFARIIHLADRVDVLLKPAQSVLQQRDEVYSAIQSLTGQVFDPDLVDLWRQLAARESFWLEPTSPWLKERLLEFFPRTSVRISTSELRELAGLFARVVDAKSPFTYRHSRSVAAVARYLGECLGGLTDYECELLEIAGLLHDLGKVSVPEEILGKPGTLTAPEFDIIKQHPYYTYWLLRPLSTNAPVAAWAAYHHESLDGQGYPFRKAGAELDLGARIIAVADVYTALREDRPYRPGLSWEQTQRILDQQVEEKRLDRQVVEALRSARTDLEHNCF